ncbi:MAG: DUF4416 family protein [Planctomycetes bacterium]|nr:DUF4416 family protein [Planctomycetota bacterium]
MARATAPQPVKLFCAVLAGQQAWLNASREVMEDELGAIELDSDIWPFDCTDYYKREMGSGLLRQIFSFQALIDPSEIAPIKLRTNDLEMELAENLPDTPERPVNLDPGYLGASKMVLATTKNYTHRIYLASGIYAEVTLRWRDGQFEPWEWTYPDYQSEAYREFFGRVRNRYMDQLRDYRKARAEDVESGIPEQ